MQKHNFVNQIVFVIYQKYKNGILITYLTIELCIQQIKMSAILQDIKIVEKQLK